MALYYLKCNSCLELDARVLNNFNIKSIECRKCGLTGKMKRVPKPPVSFLKNRIDTGIIPKTLENFDDTNEMMYKRSREDHSRPDWVKSQSENDTES